MDILTNDQWRTLCAIADCAFDTCRSANPCGIKDYKEILIEFAADWPSDHPGFKLILAQDTLQKLYPNTLHDFRGALDMLNNDTDHANPALTTSGMLYGIWNDKYFNAFNEAILTAVNTEYENIDGDGHCVNRMYVTAPSSALLRFSMTRR
ncbi:hypothetical protein LIPSTDRAFT_63450 [Lipomyces starkeyi NRRL Y-11557]|uniref:Uncharacterized protein n=1 Tax=Lipomyces starkeyi NRRL Y-11557 TaxID=675824 RepID=A0A1E3Q6B4_LIPST|nr:hypothetical protein LIPSTDRAFT_63450 [Lipomyces starkeyi NRRL Y-11557]